MVVSEFLMFVLMHYFFLMLFDVWAVGTVINKVSAFFKFKPLTWFLTKVVTCRFCFTFWVGVLLYPFLLITVPFNLGLMLYPFCSLVVVNVVENLQEV